MSINGRKSNRGFGVIEWILLWYHRKVYSLVYDEDRRLLLKDFSRFIFKKYEIGYGNFRDSDLNVFERWICEDDVNMVRMWLNCEGARDRWDRSVLKKIFWEYRNMWGFWGMLNYRWWVNRYNLIVLSGWYLCPYGDKRMGFGRFLSILAHRSGLTKFHCKLRGYR